MRLCSDHDQRARGDYQKLSEVTCIEHFDSEVEAINNAEVYFS